MALLETPIIDKHITAPDFSLKNIDGKTLSFDDVKGEKGTVIAFISNHCPYVQAIIDRLVDTSVKLKELGVNTVAIMPNDTTRYPDDSFENMALFSKQHNFSFPYLIDETQNVAKAYDAICTPDIFGVDENGVIQYRGRVDSAGKNPASENTIPELLLAMKDIAEKGTTDKKQFPSMGCSIKWFVDAA